MADTARKTFVIGHKNPDTDSICSAICYANLKHKIRGKEYIPARAGSINEETQFVLDYFNIEAPVLLSSVKTQVRDIEIRRTPGVFKNISLKKAWTMMQEANVVTIPVVTSNGMLEGLITVNDIAMSFMNMYDSTILSQARTKYSNIIETLGGSIVVGNENAIFSRGKVLIAAANPDMMESYIEKDDLVILGNRYESQLCAIEMEAACLIVCEGAPISMTIRKLAQERQCTIISTPYDTFTVAKSINQSMPIGHFMRTENLVTFAENDFIDDIKEVMASKRHRDFPILDEQGHYKGMISRRNLLGAQGKDVILVDHNERNQAIDGVENAHIKEIIDHHRIGTLETISPVFFRNQPLGCTATIIYQMYHEANVEIEPWIAGLLCSAIISDTLLFRSPTCKDVDKQAALDLAQIAGLNIEKFAVEMFSAGSNLRGKSDDELFYQDFKKFTAGKISFGVGQIISMNESELEYLHSRVKPYMEEAKKAQGLDMVFFMLTNILTESTELLCEGSGAELMVLNAFRMEIPDDLDEKDGVVNLPGVVSRKKQLVPKVLMAAQD